jgi:transposase
MRAQLQTSPVLHADETPVPMVKPGLRRTHRAYLRFFDRRIIEVGCMAHARRKLHDLYADHRGEFAEEGLRYFAALYEIEREARELKLDAACRQQLRQQRSKPIAESLRQWLTRQRVSVARSRTAPRHAKQSSTAWDAERRRSAISTTAICPSTTTT